MPPILDLASMMDCTARPFHQSFWKAASIHHPLCLFLWVPFPSARFSDAASQKLWQPLNCGLFNCCHDLTLLPSLPWVNYDNTSNRALILTFLQGAYTLTHNSHKEIVLNSLDCPISIVYSCISKQRVPNRLKKARVQYQLMCDLPVDLFLSANRCLMQSSN